MTQYNELDTPNVQLILSQGIRIVRGKLPAYVRKELSAGVKNKRLAHIKKDGLKPEAYCAIDQIEAAKQMRLEIALNGIMAISKVCC
jgi:hypothetical protein